MKELKRNLHVRFMIEVISITAARAGALRVATR